VTTEEDEDEETTPLVGVEVTAWVTAVGSKLNGEYAMDGCLISALRECTGGASESDELECEDETAISLNSDADVETVAGVMTTTLVYDRWGSFDNVRADSGTGSAGWIDADETVAGSD
jgi:hypothetical protein